jgi:thiamine biosynthesis lipoprotein ApbE
MSMNTRWLLTVPAAALMLALGVSLRASGPAASRTFVSNYENVLGTSLELKVHGADPAAAARAEQAVLAEIARESHSLSSWDPTSEVSRWFRSKNTPVTVSPELFEVLSLFDQWRAKSHGALDASAQTVIGVWKTAAARQRVPSASELSAAVQTVHQQHWTLDPPTRTATHLTDTPLVFASFTKSYIIDRAVDAALAVNGVQGVVLNIGGDIVARGEVTEPVAIADPKDDAENAAPMTEIAVRDKAVATSGDYRRGVDINGVHYSHIVDPRTGATAEDVISSTVVATNPTDAGALATAFSILTPAESQSLAASIPGTDYLLVLKDGTRISSRGWRQLEHPTAATPAPAPAARTVNSQSKDQWDPSMELAVNFEIPVLGGAAKRPFIAIWIEDADRFPVRTLALWYHEDRWLPELKAWYRADKLRSMSEKTSIVRSIGAATRPPGKYTMKWDGKDTDGQPVKPGKYTVFLESSREHGTYQLVRQEMTFDGKPQHFEFTPGTEVSAGSFDYRKVGK